MSSIKISCLSTITHITFSFGTNCPKLFPLSMALGGISPVAAYRSEQPGAVCQGCISTAVYRRLALDWRPRLFYFPAARRGYILQSRTISHDWERAGGLGWTWSEVYLWILPTVPMSVWWKRSRIKKHPPRTRRSFRCLLRGGCCWMGDLFHHALIGTVGKVHK